jgi:hypothetical protein
MTSIRPRRHVALSPASAFSQAFAGQIEQRPLPRSLRELALSWDKERDQKTRSLWLSEVIAAGFDSFTSKRGKGFLEELR